MTAAAPGRAWSAAGELSLRQSAAVIERAHSVREREDIVRTALSEGGSIRELFGIYGMGARKIESLGGVVLETINAHA